MKLIIGLGNPGIRYKNTWHNIGFAALDQFQKNNEFENFALNNKFKAEISIGKIGREKIILAKPQTFMNASGEAVVALSQFYKVATEDILVVHDDVDLNLGKLRIAKDSSAGGHNGIKSIITLLGSQNFTRIKIGVSTDRKTVVGTMDYVLEKIPSELKKQTNDIIKKTAEAIEAVIRDGIQSAMNQFN